MYKKFRFYFRLFIAFTSKYILLIVLGMVLAGVTSVFLPHIAAYIPRLRKVDRIGIVGKYSLSDLPLSVLNKISFGLTTVNAQGLPAPGLAQSWEVSKDGTVFTFRLNKSLVWQNGNPLKSADIRYQFRDAVFESPDDSTLVVRLKEPFAPLPVLLSKPILKITNSGLFSRQQLIGTGAYKITSYKNNGLQLEEIDLYPVNGDSDLPALRYNFYTSPQQSRIAFKLGLLDEIEEVSDPVDLSGWPNSKVVPETVDNRYVGVFFNTDDPLLSGQAGRDLRTALTYAIDKSHWKNRAIGPINPESWAFNPDIKRYDYDLDKARDLLKKVDKIPAVLKLSTVPAYADVAESIKKDWAKLNIKTEITISPEFPTDFQILLIAQAIPTDPDQYNLWHSTQDVTNLTHLNNPRIDKLLEDGRKTYDIGLRKKIYQDFQKYLVEENPVAFLYYPQIYTIYKK
jgi:peptide/nickel transport system substrate-binding protein